MTAHWQKIRRWPYYLLGSVLLLALISLVFPLFDASINLPLKARPPGPGHWLGTDALGRDLLGAIAKGASRSLFISIGGGLAASAIGVFTGSVSAFFADDLLKVSSKGVIMLFLLLLALLYGSLVLWPVVVIKNAWATGAAVSFFLLILLWLLYRFLDKIPVLRKKWIFPFDQLVQRFSEVFTVIPRLYLIVVFALIIPLNVFTLTLLLSLTSWVGISRLVRAEMIRVRSMPYIESARIMGIPEWRIYRKHALPNSLQPVATQVCFTMAGLLITESTLSFVGIGISPEVLSWGSIIHGYLENPQAWWLAFFPAVVIYVVVISYHAIGNDLDNRLHFPS